MHSTPCFVSFVCTKEIHVMDTLFFQWPLGSLLWEQTKPYFINPLFKVGHLGHCGLLCESLHMCPYLSIEKKS